ncbi:MAG: hypothetical protein LBO66_03155, partial [Deltaproteobacteria bacterium]|nr:hypothetical protein [Deltaproteobacteria bacterium]
VQARGFVLSLEASEKYEKELVKMDPNIVLMMDRMTDGKFSETHAKYKALVRENKAKDKALREAAKAKDKAIREEAKAKDKALREAAKALKEAAKDKETAMKVKEETARFKKDAILALRADNKSVEEISAKLKISLAEVGQILDNAKKKVK